MKQLIIGLAALICCPALAKVDPKIHRLCIQAKDYAGCVKAMTTAPTAEDELNPLRNAMKQVSSRLRSGTSLRDSTETYRPVVDQLAIVASNHQDSLAVKNARLATKMFDALQLAWDTRIKAANYTLNKYGGIPAYDCEALLNTVKYYNGIPDAPNISWSYTKARFWGTTCKVESSQLPETYMIRNVIRVLEEGSITPSEIAEKEKIEKERQEKLNREKELCAMEPWTRYLSENPSMKQWTLANPKAAEAAKKKFIEDPANTKDCSTNYFTKFKFQP
jgi:hypothetical protein